MNRKHNALVALVALLLLTAILLLVGCTEPAAATGSAAEEAETTARFTSEYIEGDSINMIGSPDTYIITDNETGVQYLWIKSGYGGGLTVLQPATEEATQ